MMMSVFAQKKAVGFLAKQLLKSREWKNVMWNL